MRLFLRSTCLIGALSFGALTVADLYAKWQNNNFLENTPETVRQGLFLLFCLSVLLLSVFPAKKKIIIQEKKSEKKE